MRPKILELEIRDTSTSPSRTSVGEFVDDMQLRCLGRSVVITTTESCHFALKYVTTYMEK